MWRDAVTGRIFGRTAQDALCELHLMQVHPTEGTMTDTTKSTRQVHEELDQAFDAFVPSFAGYELGVGSAHMKHLQWRGTSSSKRLLLRPEALREAVIAHRKSDVINDLTKQAFLELVDHYPEEVMAWVDRMITSHRLAWRWREIRMQRYRELFIARSKENEAELERLEQIMDRAEYLTVQWQTLLEQFSHPFSKERSDELAPVQRFVRKTVHEHIRKALHESGWQYDWTQLRSL